MLRQALIILVIFISGCGGANSVSRERDIGATSRQEGLVVSCSGFKSWPECYRAAEKACPGGYEIIGKEENLVTQSRTLRINCK